MQEMYTMFDDIIADKLTIKVRYFMKIANL